MGNKELLSSLIASFTVEIEKELDNCFQIGNDKGRYNNCPSELMEAVRYAVLGGGKRLRPFLINQWAKLFGANSKSIITAACGIECIHCYSLVHDDLPCMDDDDYRRGKLSVHKKYGEDVAVLVGDALLGIGLELTCSLSSNESSDTVLKLVVRLLDAIGLVGMIGGQYLDQVASSVNNHFKPSLLSVSSEDIYINKMKTGCLFGYACEAGAILGGASIKEIAAAREYGLQFGILFQSIDDITDGDKCFDSQVHEIEKYIEKLSDILSSVRIKSTLLTDLPRFISGSLR